MKARWHVAVIAVFLLGVVLTGTIGTSASTTFLWPACGVLGLAAALSIGLLFQETTFALPKWSLMALFAFGGYLLVRAANSPVAYFAREDVALLVTGFLVYGLFLLLLVTTQWRRRFVDLLALLVLLNLGFALIQALFSPTLWLVPGYERTFPDQAGGLFNHPDHYAGFLAMLVPLWLTTALFSRRERLARIGAAALAAASILAVIVSGSAPAILALGIGSVAFVALAAAVVGRRIPADTRKRIYRRSAFGLLAASIAVLAASGPLSRALDRHLLSKNGDLSLPLVWKAGWEQAREAPLLGTGSRTSQIYGRLFREESLGTASTEPEFIHNEFLQALADYGIVGLALLLFALALHLMGGFRFVRAYSGFGGTPQRLLPQSDHLALVLGAIAALVALASLATFDFVLHLPAFVAVAAALLAALAVPDPMATALKPAPSARILPGGGWLFAHRALVFGLGLAMATLASVFSRSEIHYEMARRAFEENPAGFQHLPHLKAARTLDPKNPWAATLSAHAQVAGILPEMPEPARRQALEQADAYFSHARRLYPQDIFAAVGHAAVLDELGRSAEALDRLREAREFAPRYGNVMLAEAELHLRHGRISDSERVFAEALGASAFRDTLAAQRGLMTVTEWKLIAEQNGLDWRSSPDPVESEPLLAGPDGYRSLPEAKVAERELAGQSPKPQPQPEKEGEGEGLSGKTADE